MAIFLFSVVGFMAAFSERHRGGSTDMNSFFMMISQKKKWKNSPQFFIHSWTLVPVFKANLLFYFLSTFGLRCCDLHFHTFFVYFVIYDNTCAHADTKLIKIWQFADTLYTLWYIGGIHNLGSFCLPKIYACCWWKIFW